MSFDALVLCGGDARRLGGIDKATVTIGGKNLLARALDAVADAATTIAVGPPRPTDRDVTWVQEEPPGGGPVAGIAAGLPLVGAATVVILGVDFPFVDRSCVARVVASRAGCDGAIVGDATGRHQFLVGAYARSALERELTGHDPRGMAVRELMAGLDVVVLDDPRAARDCDTWEDVAAAEASLDP